MEPIQSYIKTVFPSLKYIITICTGSTLLASTGLLNGRQATTNKSTYSTLTPLYPSVTWIPKARWVVDETPGVPPVWSSSGITAGIDVTFAFIKMLYGDEAAGKVANVMEYERHEDDRWDPFADVWGLVAGA